MISFKHHALYWVLSLLTVPLTSIRKLLFGHELFMGAIDEVEFATVCLSLYSIARPVLNIFQNSRREVEVGVTKCSGLVKAADLEKPVEEISITKEPESRNGNAKGPKPKKGRKKPAKNANGKPRAVQSQKKEAQNGDAKLSNGNGALQNIAAAQRLRKKSTGRLQSFFNWTWKYLDFLYFLSLGIFFTHTEPLIGFRQCVGNDHLQSVGRVLVSFLVMGTLEPIRQNYWPWWPGIWFADSLSGPDIFIRVWLLVPLIDVAETVLYAISSRTRPEWYKRRLELMERPL
ncbi:uncharacterized protein FTJAE_9607 [Fusarium tjaetaba]|uniref:Transmembrane protein n=1 Tax=Fusarium tjaetaba TaxID=1567544 RepID=A0A8H5R4Z4_9HYPO|nr:uncharacterized protein FTJAE_9607 [Fusarium tjaetaba]KAF5626548.1 hypothetical protein FTJAE_9607 [Fusarium tjaetaba]